MRRSCERRWVGVECWRCRAKCFFHIRAAIGLARAQVTALHPHVPPHTVRLFPHPLHPFALHEPLLFPSHLRAVPQPVPLFPRHGSSVPAPSATLFCTCCIDHFAVCLSYHVSMSRTEHSQALAASSASACQQEWIYRETIPLENDGSGHDG